MLVGLIGVNVYVFFFNRGTAPREILNMQSTSKTFDSARQEALRADVRRAGELVASSSGAKAGAKTAAAAPSEAQAPSPREAQAPSPREAQVPSPREAQVPSPREAGRGLG